MKKNEMRTFSHTTYSNKLKMDSQLIYKTRDYKTPRRKYRQQFFLDLYPKAKETKAKINKWNLTKLKSFSQQRKLSMK